MSHLLFTNLLGALAAGAGAIGVWAAGSGRRIGWGICLAAEFLWLYYAIVLQQWTLLPWCIVWGAVYVRNWKKSS